jgi:hypothetical protein
MNTHTIQIISNGWHSEIQANMFSKSAIIDAEISLITPTTNTPGFIYKNKLETTKISIKQNENKYDVVIELIVSNCLDWMDNSIQEKLNKSLYFQPAFSNFI